MTATAEYRAYLAKGRTARFVHGSRFAWLATVIGNPASVVELGCFDGALKEVLAADYTGLDQNEAALQMGRLRFPLARFERCATPAMLYRLNLPRHDVAVCMETFEHIRPDDVSDYLAALACVADKLIVTVPNEQGLAFLIKWLGKIILRRQHTKLSLATFFNTVTCRRGRERQPSVIKADGTAIYDHSGFDYRDVIGAIAAHWRIESIVGVQWPRLPLWANFTIGIVALRPLGDVQREVYGRT